MKESLVAFDGFIWQDCSIESVEQLVDFEKEYQHYDKSFGFCYDNDIGLFRRDAYYYGVPPVAQSLCEILNTAIQKLPPVSAPLIRKCNEYDKVDFQAGDVFEPGFCLTTSADPSWGDDTSVSLYRITPFDVAHTKARAMFLVNNNTEYQVTFLQDVRFCITSIDDEGDGKKVISIEEIE